MIELHSKGEAGQFYNEKLLTAVQNTPWAAPELDRAPIENKTQVGLMQLYDERLLAAASLSCLPGQLLW